MQGHLKPKFLTNGKIKNGKNKSLMTLVSKSKGLIREKVQEHLVPKNSLFYSLHGMSMVLQNLTDQLFLVPCLHFYATQLMV